MVGIDCHAGQFNGWTSRNKLAEGTGVNLLAIADLAVLYPSADAPWVSYTFWHENRREQQEVSVNRRTISRQASRRRWQHPC